MTNTEFEGRALTILKVHGGRASLDQIRAAKTIPGVHVPDVMRALISGKRVLMDSESSYLLANGSVAESPQLAGTHTAATEPKEHRVTATVKPSSGPAEPKKRRGPTPRPKAPIECFTCNTPYPPEHYQREGRRPSGRKLYRYRNCAKCREKPSTSKRLATAETQSKSAGRAKAPAPQTSQQQAASPLKTIGDVVERIQARDEKPAPTLRLNPTLTRYLEQLLATGLYGATIEEAAERVLCFGLVEALGVIKLEFQR